jgi:hypothetical protein
MRNGVIEAPRATSQPDTFHRWPCGSAAQVLRSCHSEPTLCCERASGAHGPVPVGNRQLPNGNKRPARLSNASSAEKHLRLEVQQPSPALVAVVPHNTVPAIVSYRYGMVPHTIRLPATPAHTTARARALPARPPAPTGERS